MSDAARGTDRRARDGAPVQLRRTLSESQLVLYGVGVTVGAGIYVLTGTVIETTGALAPLSFLVSAILAGLTALSFSELSVRHPRAAGEALYVRRGLGSAWLALTVGLAVVVSGTISSAAIVRGFSGYLRVMLDIPDVVVIPAVVLLLTLLAIWGIRQAVTMAAVLTVIEVGGLLLIIWVARDGFLELDAWASSLVISASPADLVLLGSGAVLAFFAFIGFEDMVNVAEEVRDVHRVMPRAIIVTLLVTTVLYVCVTLVALLAPGAADLALSEAPLADLYARSTGSSPLPIVLIGTVAIINGALIQIIMGSRVIYGLAEQGDLPEVFGRVHPRTRTPIHATVLVGAVVAAGAVLLPLELLARLASLIVLSVFVLVNISLVRIKRRDTDGPKPDFEVPVAIPVAGAVTSLVLVVFQLVSFARAGL
ncbi:MAG: amino acid permease [Alphaproteobacteria bacterium]|nr:amino acid permease [Alphaproteobacteria bacterium]